MVRKIFSILLILLLIPLFTIFLIAISLKFSILNPNFLKTTLAETDIYNTVIEQGAPALLNSIGDNGKFGMGPLSAKDLSQIVRKSIDVSWLKAQTEKTIKGFFDFSYGKTSKMEIIIPLSEFKKTIAEKFTKTLNEKVPAMPECSAEELQKLQENESMTFNCLPKGMNSEEVVLTFTEPITGKDGLITKLPDQYNLGEIIVKNPSQADTVQRFFTIFGKVFQTLWIAILIIIALIILINRKYPSAMLKWIAIPILIPSVIILLMGLVGGLFTKLLTIGYMGMLPADFKQAASSLQDAIISRFSYNFILFSGISVAICITLLIISSIINRKNNPEPKK